MADELRDEGVGAAAACSAPEARGAARASRRAYARPALTEFGTVHELTRGGSGVPGDGGKLRNVKANPK
jgi:hypothetical protein